MKLCGCAGPTHEHHHGCTKFAPAAADGHDCEPVYCHACEARDYALAAVDQPAGPPWIGGDHDTDRPGYDTDHHGPRDTTGQDTARLRDELIETQEHARSCPSRTWPTSPCDCAPSRERFADGVLALSALRQLIAERDEARATVHEGVSCDDCGTTWSGFSARKLLVHLADHFAVGCPRRALDGDA